MTDVTEWIRDHEPERSAGVPTSDLRDAFDDRAVDRAINDGDVYESGGSIKVTPHRTDPWNKDKPAQSSAPTWLDILDQPFVALILGRRGSGKTALGHRFLEVFQSPNADRPRDTYIMGFPYNRMELLPDWINHLSIQTPFEQWPSDAIVLITEAHHIMHARRSMQDENLELDRLVTLSRQRDLDIVLDTQYARRLDVTGVMGATAMIWRYPGLMQEDFERRQLRKFVREAKDALSEYVTTTETDDYVLLEDDGGLHKHAYVIGERFRGLYPREIRLPSYWSESISEAIGAPGDEAVKMPPSVTAAMADLDDVEEKAPEEIDALLDEAGLEEAEPEDVDVEAAEPEGVDAEAVAAAEEFIDRMIESGNRVFTNPWGWSAIELIVPSSFEDEAEAIVEKWLLNPQGNLAVPQDPSFAEDRPEVSEGLTSFQFFLGEEPVEDLTGADYDLRSIIDELPDDKWIATKSRSVRASLV